ncbi:MAG: hypothetical protein ACTSWY_02785 [Promethearchaeota archaeon]
MLEKFLEIPKKKILAAITIISFICVIIVNLIFGQFQDILLPYTIIDFEFSWTGSRAQEIITSWESNGGLQPSIIFNYIDFSYMFFYGIMGWGLILLVARSLKDKFQKIGLTFSVLPLIAAFFDVIENINLLIMQYNGGFDITAFIAGVSATIKFGCLFIAIGFFLYGLIVITLSAKKKK